MQSGFGPERGCSPSLCDSNPFGPVGVFGYLSACVLRLG